MRRSTFATAALALISQPVLAAEAAPATRTGAASYAAGFYAPFNPQTALDIVVRTPGFVLQEGRQLRGFGGSAGNVLVDGVRPSTKSAGLEDVLRRIPAAHVERVEVIRGAQTSEAHGQATVLNIVRKAVRSGGAWSAEIERNGSGLVYPRLEATLTRRLGEWDTSLKANSYWEQFPYRTLRLNRDGAGELTSSWVDDRPTTLTEGFVSGDASRAAAGGVLQLNGRFGWQRFYYDLESDIFLGREPGGAPDRRGLYEYDREDWTLELGGDYTRAVRGWTWKTLGLANAKVYGDEQADARRTADGQLISRSDARLNQLPIEALARTTFSRAAGGALRPEFGAEVAYNRLESRFTLVADDGVGPRPVPLPAADVLVQEWRGEAFANVTWQASERLRLEGALSGEASRITVSGDADNARDFVFAKPSAAAVWRLSPRAQFRLAAARTVGQLNFSDFAASAELQDQETVAGNPELGPDKTTRVAASLDYRGDGGLAVNVEAYREWRQDVLEQVLLPSGAPGLANAGDAAVWGVKANLAVPLNRLADGLSLRAEGEARRSRFADPLTGRTRRLSELRTPTFRVELLHAPAGSAWNWGVNAASYDGLDGTLYLVDQVDDTRFRPTLGGFVETTRLPGVRTRLSVRNAATERIYRLRSFYAPDRSGRLIATDERRSARGTFVTLRFDGRF